METQENSIKKRKRGNRKSDPSLEKEIRKLARYTLRRGVTVRAFVLDMLNLMDALDKRPDTKLVVGNAVYERYFKD